MGYSLYITRSEPPGNAGSRKITRDEWRAYVAQDSELDLDESLGEGMVVWSGPSRHDVPWIRWSDGMLESKYPDPPLIEKMTRIADALGAIVEGEDGEIYLGGGRIRKPRPSGLRNRARRWLSDLFTKPSDPVDPASLPFGVGDRVRDSFGREGVVTRIDVHANQGLGKIEVVFDDGAEYGHAVIAHGLELVDGP